MPYVRAWADNSRQSLLRLTTSAAPSTMLTLSGGEAECAYGAGFLADWSDSGSRPRSAPRPRWQLHDVDWSRGNGPGLAFVAGGGQKHGIAAPRQFLIFGRQ